MADIWVPLRAGTDIVFLGALINYVLANAAATSASTSCTTPTPRRSSATTSRTRRISDGLFSGWDETERKYRPDSWLYAGVRADGGGAGRDARAARTACGARTAAAQPHDLIGRRSRSRRCSIRAASIQLLKRHFARYTPELVEQRLRHRRKGRSCAVAETFCVARPGPDKTARSATPSAGRSTRPASQIIRAAAILQLLLGNIGRPGGGIMALRGHASIQGSTDIPTLYDILPGYLPMPNFEAGTHTLANYIEQNGAETGWWHNIDKYIVSLLKAWYGDAATRGERLRLQLAAAHHRRSFAPGLLARHGRRQDGRAVRLRPESRRSARRTRGWSAARWPSSIGWSCATWSKSRPPASGTTRRKSSAAN